ncbi:MAG: DHA2 family efflux MFS transporter permease subunit, partial [Cyanobacteria bacterium]|nr:DHA2 family efflux MFS transporter permease subunit [Cyanobacteriota bacterium]
LCVVLGPILGPVVGGYLTDNLNWRWNFYINLPLGLIALWLCQCLLPDDSRERDSEIAVDWCGIILLCISLGSLQYVLERGRQDDWFSCQTITVLSITCVVGTVAFIAREFTTTAPAVDLRIFRHRTVAVGIAYSMVLGAILYGTIFEVPSFVQMVLNFNATQAGLLQMPGCIVSGILLPIVGLYAQRIDARLLVGVGAFLLAIFVFQLSGMTPSSGGDDFFWPLIIRGFGAVLMYLPLTLATLTNCSEKDIQGATALFDMFRQLGGSMAIAAMTTVLDSRLEFHRLRISENITPFNQFSKDFVGTGMGLLQQHGFSKGDAYDRTIAIMHNEVSRQALVMSFNDVCYLMGLMRCCTLPIVFFLGDGKITAETESNPSKSTMRTAEPSSPKKYS